MIDNAPDSTTTTTTTSASTFTTGSATFRRYAPPPQRKGVISRRKSGDRFDRTNNPWSEGEKSQAASSRTVPILDHGEAGGSDLLNENPQSRLITINGCCGSVAAQLLTDRWAAAMHSYNDPSVDLSGTPTIVSTSSISASKLGCWPASKLKAWAQ